MKIKIKKLRPDARIPSYAHPGDVGMDLYSVDEGVILPGERKYFYCGFAMEFEPGHAAIIKDKSSRYGKADEYEPSEVVTCYCRLGRN